MENSSDDVQEGRLIHETAYPGRSEKHREIELAGIKIDYFDPKTGLIHEIKKSDTIEEANVWQLKYYVYVLQNHGIDCRGGILEYPRLRQKKDVLLTSFDIEIIKESLEKIQSIVQSPSCPPVINASFCKKCAYYDFCYITEDESNE